MGSKNLVTKLKVVFGGIEKLFILRHLICDTLALDIPQVSPNKPFVARALTLAVQQQPLTVPQGH